jgi:hypothetical protein
MLKNKFLSVLAQKIAAVISVDLSRGTVDWRRLSVVLTGGQQVQVLGTSYSASVILIN